MEIDTFRTIRYDMPIKGVARIMMARPEVRNAQNIRMTYELNAAFDAAESNEAVRVVLFGGDGPHFSSGHDLAEKFDEHFPRVGPWGAVSTGGAERSFAAEMEIFFGMCERWRDLSKPTIALVQGKCIAGALMLAWACDLIIAADDASFKDPTLDMGVMGAEFFMHPWELGFRRAKEFLFTTQWLSAEAAWLAGMVNRVVARAELADAGLALAEQIAAKPAFAVRTAKLAVNAAQDGMGRMQAMRHSFALHHLTHAHNEIKFGMQMDPSYARSQAGGNVGFDKKIGEWTKRINAWGEARDIDSSSTENS